MNIIRKIESIERCLRKLSSDFKRLAEETDELRDKNKYLSGSIKKIYKYNYERYKENRQDKLGRDGQ